VIRAAGILLVALDGTALFLKRPPSGDHAGQWCIPGGKLEEGEDSETAAKRECREEIGHLPKGELRVLTRVKKDFSQQTSTALPVAESAAAPQPVTAPPQAGAADGGVDFTTYILSVPKQFEPKLDGEHVGHAWAPLSSPPQPLHPGVAISLARMTMDETQVARAIMRGDLTSPQRYENVTLFAVRITGTGTSYRKKLDEFVYRPPENYLTQEFLDRCNGLPVIILHPEGALLNSEEFGERNVGSIVMPYLQGDEVWGIAKIYDDAAARIMEEKQLSTSPAVFFRDPSVNDKLTLENGSKLLIEGKPSLLDHLAICEHGVWDKGEGPTGVKSETREDANMADEKELEKDKKSDSAKTDTAKADAAKADTSKADADAGTKLDKILACVDSLSGRMDAYDEERKADRAKKDAEEEEKKEKKADSKNDSAKKDESEDEKKDKKADSKKDAEGDPEKVVADKAKKDEDKDDKKEDKKMDSVKADDAGGNADVRRMIADVAAKLPKQLSDADYDAFASEQAKADTVFSALGERASRPQDGENLLAYRRRLAKALQPHSKAWKDVNLSAIADDAAFSIAQGQIYSDAMDAATNPVDLPFGTLREIISADGTGRRITSFAGQPLSWMGQFAGSRRRLSGFRSNKDR
jgi:8-oxo-dGTP pyrophosphatase MutT (NUDIX family)